MLSENVSMLENLLMQLNKKKKSLKCSDLVHWGDPEGLGGEGGRRGDRDGEYM